MRWINAREARLLRREEARLAALADRTLLVERGGSRAAARTPAGRGARLRSAVLANGIDAAQFDPAARRAAPGAGAAGPAPRVHRADGLPAQRRCRAARYRQAHAARARRPSCGPVPRRRPRPGRRADVARDGRNGARIWGEVPDVRPFLAAADLALMPLGIARGVQNKLLEAMAMARPAVVTRAAATGIAGEDGRHFAVADERRRAGRAGARPARQRPDRAEHGRGSAAAGGRADELAGRAGTAARDRRSAAGKSARCRLRPRFRSPPRAAAPVPTAWRAPLLRLALAWLGLAALVWRDWADMAHQWWDSSTYNHVLLIPPILVWLVALRWSRAAPPDAASLVARARPGGRRAGGVARRRGHGDQLRQPARGGAAAAGGGGDAARPARSRRAAVSARLHAVPRAVRRRAGARRCRRSPPTWPSH